jgi:hypothetical protein
MSRANHATAIALSVICVKPRSPGWFALHHGRITPRGSHLNKPPTRKGLLHLPGRVTQSVFGGIRQPLVRLRWIRCGDLYFAAIESERIRAYYFSLSGDSQRAVASW